MRKKDRERKLTLESEIPGSTSTDETHCRSMTTARPKLEGEKERYCWTAEIGTVHEVAQLVHLKLKRSILMYFPRTTRDIFCNFSFSETS